MMEERFPDELLWQDDGHATELAVTALADGEGELVSEGLSQHVDECERCTERLQQAAQLSFSVTTALAVRKSSPQGAWARGRRRVPTAVPVPLGGVLGASFLVVLGMLPALAHAPKTFAALGKIVLVLPLSLRSLRAALPLMWQGAGAEWTLVSLFAGLVMLMAGFMVARSAPLGASGGQG